MLSVVGFNKEKIMDDLNQITAATIGAAMEVHKELGPGLLESVYEVCLAYELQQRGLKVKRQTPLPVRYQGIDLDCGFRLDLLVEESVLVELKAVEKLQPIHEAQVLTYLKLSGCKLGLLINFNTKVLKDGIHRLAL